MISIIVPHYCTNMGYFDKCMQSLLNDRQADIEVLIIDDGSPKEYLENIKRYEIDKRVRVFCEMHGGVSNARNKGIKEAAGEWVMFVDSDDYLENGYAKELEQFISEKEEADVLIYNGYGDKYGDCRRNKYFIKENKDYAQSIVDKCKVIGSGLSLGRTPVFYRCYYTLGAPCSKLIRTDFLRKNDIQFNEDVKFAEDTLFSMELLFKANHIYYKELYLYHYYMNEQSVTGKYRKGLSDDMDVFFREAWRFISDNGLNENMEDAYKIRAFLEAQRCIRQEFCHKKNSDKSSKQQAKAFIRKEPYHSGINSKNRYMSERESRVAAFLLKHEMINTYMLMYDGLTKIRKMRLSKF